MNNFENSLGINSFDLARKKEKEFGYFAMTAEDHKALGSTPDDVLKDNAGKALHELLSDDEIEEYIEGAIQTIKENDENLQENGYLDIQRNFLRVSLPFLKSINRLPEKFADFNISI